MKLDRAAISIHFEQEGMYIELHDRKSSTTFAKVFITPENAVSALSRLAYVPCRIEVKDLGIINKKMEHLSFEFCLDLKSTVSLLDQKEIAIQKVKEKCPKGWIPDLGFNSQGSFFARNKKHFARTIIRRWV